MNQIGERMDKEEQLQSIVLNAGTSKADIMRACAHRSHGWTLAAGTWNIIL